MLQYGVVGDADDLVQTVWDHREDNSTGKNDSNVKHSCAGLSQQNKSILTACFPGRR
jgi:hypothetical protein